jgi:hypothetical protein
LVVQKEQKKSPACNSAQIGAQIAQILRIYADEKNLRKSALPAFLNATT